MTERGLYLFLRIIQYIALFIIIGLEITQIVLFKTYNDTESSENPEEFYKQHGFKYFYYIVIISTLIYSLNNLITFTRRWRTGPHQKIIYVEILFLLLWLAVGFTNIYPMYFGDSKPNCNVEEEVKDIPGRITKCRTYFASMIIGWLMALLFLLTTIYLMYLWTRRDKKVDPNEKDRNEPEPEPPEPEPHPDSPVV